MVLAYRMKKLIPEMMEYVIQTVNKNRELEIGIIDKRMICFLLMPVNGFY